MKNNLTLRQTLELMKIIKQNDWNNEYEVYISGTPTPHIVIQEKLIRIGDIHAPCMEVLDTFP